MGTGYAVYTLIVSISALKDTGLEDIIIVPALLLYLAQIIAYLVIGYFLLRGIYHWSAVAIIANTIASPIVLAIILATFTNRFDAIVDFSTPVGIGILLFFLLAPLVLGVIAYNDLRYRLPKIKMN